MSLGGLGPGTRDELLVGQDIELGFRHFFNGVLTTADQIINVTILNSKLEPIAVIPGSEVNLIETGIYTTLLNGNIFSTPGTFFDVWTIIPIAGASQRKLKFDINVVTQKSAIDPGVPVVGINDTCSLEDLNACFLIENYLWPVWSILANGYYLPHKVIQKFIDDAISWMQRKLNLPLKQIRVKTQPFADEDLSFGGVPGALPILGVDFDEEGDLQQWSAQYSEQWSTIRLPHTDIIRVDGVRGIFNGQTVYRIPDEWVLRNELRMGFVRIRPTTTGSINSIVDNSGQFLDVTLLEAIGKQFVPGFWAVDYVYGSKNSKLAPEICDVIAKKAAVTLLSQIGQNLSRGLASRSASVDGISSSLNTVANAERTIFGALEKRYEEDLEEVNIIGMKQRYKGPSLFVF